RGLADFARAREREVTRAVCSRVTTIMPRPRLLVLFALPLLVASCERCSKNGAVAPDGTSSASSSAPPVVVVQPDGATVSHPAVITEALASKVAGPVPTTKMTGIANPMSVECKSAGQPVSPTIFGVAFADEDKDLGATAHRWGGNTTTRYNWKLSAWN